MSNEEAQIYIIALAGSFTLISVVIFIVFILKIYLKRHKQFLQEKQLLQSQFTQTLLQTQLEIQEQTLQNISQEIHDNTSQLLGLIKLNLATANSTEEKVKEKINASHELVQQVIGSIRQMSHTLDTGFVERMGLKESIRYQLEMVQKSGQFQTSLDVQGTEIKTDPQKELILFRMVQESLNNIIRHANASEIKVRLEYAPGKLSIAISDNGTGFQQSEDKQQGIGLQNMHNRAKLIGAELNIQSELNKGTSTMITLPINN